MPFSLYAQGLQTFIIFSPQALPSHQVISELKKRNDFFLMWRRELGVHAERTLWFSVSVAQESWHSNKRKQSWVLVHGLFLFIILQVLGRANSVMLKPECNFSFFFFSSIVTAFFLMLLSVTGASFVMITESQNHTGWCEWCNQFRDQPGVMGSPVDPIHALDSESPELLWYSKP